jgi:signal-transduction protein with cAMP-binding, CBS, and nucleotidyltransferase domain
VVEGAAELVRVVCNDAGSAACVADLERLDDVVRRRFQALDRMGVPLETVSETMVPAVDALVRLCYFLEFRGKVAGDLN